MTLNGLLLINKPADITSHDVVARLRKNLHQKDIGHTGTLDPMATGLMVMVLGEATKISDYLMMDEKSYRLRVQLGVRTDTLDRTGKVLSEQKVDLDPEVIRKAALEMVGDFEWPVPVFSAMKVDGERLYEAGRRGDQIETPVKKMKFWDAHIEEVFPSGIQLSISCSKGSFIRTWAAQLGEKLGVGGMLSELCRLSVGPWRLENAVDLTHPEPQVGLIPLGEALPALKAFFVEGKDQRLLLNGQVPRDLASRLIFEQKEAIRRQETVTVKVLDHRQNMLALVAAIPGQGVKIRRVFKVLG